MRSFADINPIALFVYFFSVASVAMFFMHPVVLCISLVGALSLYIIRNGAQNAKTHLFSFVFFAMMALINPLVSHNGVTVLFVVNNSPVTLEALVYGIFAAVMIISVMYWFYSFSQIMTSDKLLYAFGAFSPKTALILSMSLRYIPLFKQRISKISSAQKALGLCRDDNIIDSAKSKLRVFSIMVTWALENGITTADSMAAKGYGTHKRTNFSHCGFTRSDAIFTALCTALLIVAIFCIHDTDFAYYPAISPLKLSAKAKLGCVMYGILALLPVIIEIKEDLKWKYLRSKI